MTTPSPKTGEGTASKAVLDRIASFRSEPFVPDKDVWKYYFQRFELEMSILQLNETKYVSYKRDLLLRAIGFNIYRVAAEHFDPIPLNVVEYKDLTDFLTKQYTKSTSYIIARCQFGQCYREPNQSVSDFVAKLRSLTQDCVFGSQLNERLRDQFFIGLKNPTMLERLSELHSAPTDKLDDVINSALTIEAAQQQRNALSDLTLGDNNKSNQPLNVNAVNQSSRNSSGQNNVKSKKFKGRNNSHQNKSQQSTNSSTSTSSSGNKSAQSNHSSNNNNNSNDKRLELNPTLHCLRCGYNRHDDAATCKAIKATCRLCNKTGHYDRACVSSGKASIIKKVHRVTFSNNNDQYYNDDYRHLYNITADTSVGRYIISPSVNNVILDMEYDTAADVSVIGVHTWQQLGSPNLNPATNIAGYGDNALEVLGEFYAHVQLNDMTRSLPLIVFANEGSSLFGKNWMAELGVGPLAPRTAAFLKFVPKLGSVDSKVNNVAIDDPDVKAIYNEFNILFNRETGTAKNFEAIFELTPDAQPKICKPRPVPIALKQAVGKEIDRLIAKDVLEPVNVTETPIEWASSIVIRIKRNGEVRICADFKCTINKFVKKQLHPLKTLAEILPEFAGFIEFTTIDQKDAYYQIVVHPSCRKFLVIATEKGYYQYKRMPFGITIAPMLFQKFMDTLLADLEGVVCVQDDVGTGGKTREDHLRRLRSVLRRFQDAGLALQIQKVKMLKNEIVFLGHIIDARGTRPVPTKVNAIKNMPAPTNVSELRSFLGSINQFNSFIPNLLPTCHNLHRLLEKNVRWKWTKSENDTFEKLKSLISCDQVLAHYDPNVPVTLACDACEYGIGAVLLHNYSNGQIRLISTASRTLTEAEKNYSAIDREALAIIFGVDKFYKYLFGRHFFLQSDHQPLEHIFGEKKELPKLAASRLVRWAIQLSAFNYTFKHVRGKENCIADMLSRLPISGINPTSFESEASTAINQIVAETVENLVLTSDLLRKRTATDPTLQRIVRFLNQSWPIKKDIPVEILPFFARKDLLSFEKGIIMLGSRIVIPTTLKQTVLGRLHHTHPGINAVKSLARSTVWWPSCDTDIENFVKQCDHCQRMGPKEPETPLNLWNTPDRPWERIHIDFAILHGLNWFVIIDAYSRWLEIFILSKATTDTAITELRSLFMRYGYPKQIVCDNGPQFTSANFKTFCTTNSIKLIFSTPYHSRTNGLVERAIRTFKWRYSKMCVNRHHEALAELLFVYRTTEHSTTGRTPAELFLGRKLNTIFDLLKPSVRSDIHRHQFKTKDYSDRSHRDREFEPNESIYVRRPIDHTWIPNTIETKSGPQSYILSDGKRVHSDHVKQRFITPPSAVTTVSIPDPVDPVQSTSTSPNTPVRRIRNPPRRFYDEFQY